MSEPGQILVVDDNVVNRRLLKRALEQQGHRVTLAEDGQQALELLGGLAAHTDVVLLDIVMPGLDGYATLAAIKADSALHHLPVIMISAVDEQESALRCIELGAVDYLPKPFNPVILSTRISAGLRQKRLYDAERRYLRSLERELEIGREIQAGFLPAALPQPPGWEVAACFRAAREVAGDFYDAFELPGGMLGLMIGDVCGKGVGAALFMTLFRSLLRAGSNLKQFTGGDDAHHLSGEHSFTSALHHGVLLANNYIDQIHGAANMFATVFFGMLDPASGALHYINAGHPPPLVLGMTGLKGSLRPTGPAIGLMPDAPYTISSLQLAAGDILLAFTDGVTDATNADGAFFTDERLLALLEMPASSAQRLLDHIEGALDAHMVGAEPFDDITMLAVHRGDDQFEDRH